MPLIGVPRTATSRPGLAATRGGGRLTRGPSPSRSSGSDRMPRMYGLSGRSGAGTGLLAADELADLLRRRLAVIDESAVLEADAAGGLGHEVELMGRAHDGGALLHDVAEDLDQRLLPGRVEPDERLVDEHHPERTAQTEDDPGLLLEAAAEPRRQVVDAVVEAEHVDQVVGVLLPLLGLVQAGDVLD